MITAAEFNHVIGLIATKAPAFKQARQSLVTLTDERREALTSTAIAHATIVRDLAVHLSEHYWNQAVDINDLIGEPIYHFNNPGLKFYAACEDLADALHAWDADEGFLSEADRENLVEKLCEQWAKYQADAEAA